MIIIQVINNLIKGGAQKFVVDLSIQLSEFGHEVSLIVLNRTKDHTEQYYESQLKMNDVSIIRFNRRKGSKLPLATIIKYCHTLNSIKPDIIHLHYNYQAYIHFVSKSFIRNNPKLVLTVHSTNLKITGEGSWISKKFFLKNIKVIYCSKTAFEKNAAFLNGIYIDNGIRVKENIRINKSQEKLSNSYSILNVAHILEDKNQEVLIKAVNNLNAKGVDIKLNLCGVAKSKSYYTLLNNLILNSDYPKKIELLGSRDDIDELLQLNDIFVFPSKYEGLSLAVIEALYSGIKIILSPIRELIEPFNGIPYVYFADSIIENDFESKIIEVMDLNATHEEILVQRKKHLYKFSMLRCAREYLHEYN